MSQQISISIDLDDVLSDFGTAWLSLYNNKSGDDLSIDEIIDWNLIQFILPEWKDKIFSDEIIFSKDFYFNVPVQKHAIGFMKWACENYDVSIVSASHFENFKTVHDKSKWIMKHFPFFDIRNFIPCYRKNKVVADVMIDDGAHNFNGFDGVKCLIDRPWNKKYVELDRCRFKDLMEVREYLIKHNM